MSRSIGLTSLFLQGVSSTDFLKSQLGHDVGALLCSPLEFLADTAGSRDRCMGSELVKWGPVVQGKSSDMDCTADIFSCYKR